jgi:hypothetical protein
MLKFFKKNEVLEQKERKVREAIFQSVAEEMKNGVRHEGIWLQAFSESNSDQSVAKARYIEHRVNS